MGACSLVCEENRVTWLCSVHFTFDALYYVSWLKKLQIKWIEIEILPNV